MFCPICDRGLTPVTWEPVRARASAHLCRYRGGISLASVTSVCVSLSKFSMA